MVKYFGISVGVHAAALAAVVTLATAPETGLNEAPAGTVLTVHWQGMHSAGEESGPALPEQGSVSSPIACGQEPLPLRDLPYPRLVGAGEDSKNLLPGAAEDGIEEVAALQTEGLSSPARRDRGGVRRTEGFSSPARRDRGGVRRTEGFSSPAQRDRGGGPLAVEGFSSPAQRDRGGGPLAVEGLSSLTLEQPEPAPRPREAEENNVCRKSGGNGPASSSASVASSGARTSPVVGLQCPAPPYPRAARRARIEGTVRLAVTVGDSGRVQEVSVLRSSGRSDFDDSAENTVRRSWRYRPATRWGQPVSSHEIVDIQFRLNRR